MLVRLELGEAEPRPLRLSEESRTSDGDSGVGAESNGLSIILLYYISIHIIIESV